MSISLRAHIAKYLAKKKTALQNTKDEYAFAILK
jgi:hypothetical protein